MNKPFIIILVLTMLIAGLTQAFEIIGLDGQPMNDLEPWNMSNVAPPDADEAMIRRLTDIMRPPATRLNAIEQRLATIAQKTDQQALAEALSAEQPDICADIVSLLGILRKHRRETAAWKLGMLKDQIGMAGENFAPELLMQKLTDKKPADTDPRWDWCAAAWMPFNCGIEFEFVQEEMLQNLGLNAERIADDTNRARGALLLALRQAEVAPDGSLRPAGSLKPLLAGDIVRMIAENALGQKAEANRFDERMNSLIGRRAIVSLFRDDLMDKWELEGGEFTFRSFRSNSENIIQKSLDHGALTGFLKEIFRLQGLGAEDIIKTHAARREMFLLLDSERAARHGETEDINANTDRMFQPYLKMLAAFPPCLSPYRPEPVNDRWITFVNDSTETLYPHSRDASTGNDEPPSAPIMKMPPICLLQSDCWRYADAPWQWQPRAAGSRRHLDRFTDTRSSAGTTDPEKETSQ